jgi:hypothetical protein
MSVALPSGGFVVFVLLFVLFLHLLVWSLTIVLFLTWNLLLQIYFLLGLFLRCYSFKKARLKWFSVLHW